VVRHTAVLALPLHDGHEEHVYPELHYGHTEYADTSASTSAVRRRNVETELLRCMVRITEEQQCIERARCVEARLLHLPVLNHITRVGTAVQSGDWRPECCPALPVLPRPRGGTAVHGASIVWASLLW
jgi:hypothetical protein